MNLESFGYSENLEKARTEQGYTDFVPGRVVAQHRDRYLVITESGELEAEITGNMRFQASGREDLPAVGDWVALTVFEGSLAIVHHIFPRISLLSRLAAGSKTDRQVIASNVDVALLVQALDRDFNPNRLERYLTLCYSAGIEPVVVLTKTDLIPADKLQSVASMLRQRIPNLTLVSVSSQTGEGWHDLESLFRKGLTYCMLGSSGAGKSTLMNRLCGKEIMKTLEISENTGKGKHTTTHRELILLPNGSLLIDNPGMREVGLADAGDGLESAFYEIHQLAEHCRYRDCTHTLEADCAVVGAVTTGKLGRQAYENYLKIQKENAHFETSEDEKRRKEKEFGRRMKQYKKNNPKEKR